MKIPRWKDGQPPPELGGRQKITNNARYLAARQTKLGRFFRGVEDRDLILIRAACAALGVSTAQAVRRWAARELRERRSARKLVARRKWDTLRVLGWTVTPEEIRAALPAEDAAAFLPPGHDPSPFG